MCNYSPEKPPTVIWTYSWGFKPIEKATNAILIQKYQGYWQSAASVEVFAKQKSKATDGESEN